MNTLTDVATVINSGNTQIIIGFNICKLSKTPYEQLTVEALKKFDEAVKVTLKQPEKPEPIKIFNFES